MANDPLCTRCDHPLSQHCRGEQQHTDHKEDSRMIPPRWRKGTLTCHTRHCDNPLCSCVDFKETK